MKDLAELKLVPVSVGNRTSTSVSVVHNLHTKQSPTQPNTHATTSRSPPFPRTPDYLEARSHLPIQTVILVQVNSFS